MRTSWLVLLVAVYLSLDVANPLMPGALTFGADESVEVRQAERLRVRDQIATLRTVTTPPDHLEPVDDGAGVGRRPGLDSPWIPPFRAQHARSSLRVRSVPLEDH